MTDNDVYREDGEIGPAMDDECAICGRIYGRHRYGDNLCPGPFGRWDVTHPTYFRRLPKKSPR